MRRRRLRSTRWPDLIPAVLLLAACGADAPPCDTADLVLPAGFCAIVVADSLGWARHVVVRSNRDVYVAIRSVSDPSARTASWRGGLAERGGIAALRDTDGDGRADVVTRFGDSFDAHGGTGLALRGDTLFWALDTLIVRFVLAPGELVPTTAPDVVVAGFPVQTFHGSKGLALGADDALFVGVGAPSNACQVADRAPGSPGRDPCPDRTLQAAVWRFDASGTGQRFPADGDRVASGIRNVIALDLEPRTGALFVVQHGRDQLAQTWPDLYTVEAANELPSEEMLRVDDGADFPWPWCYHAPRVGYVLAPEYGGDGVRPDRCAAYRAPAATFPAHFSPNDLVFYAGGRFPARYHGGAFIAFHGSWNRAPTQAGYLVGFLPMANAAATGPWERFADGFAGPAPVADRADARYRPTGLAVGPDGALLVADSRFGRLWRITYEGH